MNPLKLRPEQCSPFGQLVLNYLEKHPDTNMSLLAKQIGISRAGLGWICLNRCSPNEETASRLAQVIGVDAREVARLVHEHKLHNLANPDGIDYIANFGEALRTRKIPVDDATIALNTIFNALCELTQSLPDAEQPSDFQKYRRALDVVKAEFSRNMKKNKKQSGQETDNRQTSELFALAE
jgi:plasmid maintenance system antidote protein VapI